MAKKHKVRGDGEGTVFQRERTVTLKDGTVKTTSRWYAELMAGRGPDGKRIILRKTGDTRAEVQRWLSEQSLAKAENRIAVPSKQSVNDLLDSWLEIKVRGKNRKPTTELIYRRLIDNHIRPDIGGLKVQSVTSMHLERLLAKKRTSPNLSPKTVSMIHGLLSAVFKWAYLQKPKLIPVNPMEGIENETVPRKEPEFLTREEMDRFLIALATNRYGAMLELMLFTGMRIGETCGLRWQDVNWYTNEISIRQAAVGLNGKMILTTPKTPKSEGVIPVSDSVMDSLRRWSDVQSAERQTLGDSWEHPELVFTNRLGSIINPANIRKDVLPAILKTAGLRRVTPHALRHSYASYLHSLGVSIATISKLLRHSNPGITARIYVHPSDADTREAARVLGNAFTQKAVPDAKAEMH